MTVKLIAASKTANATVLVRCCVENLLKKYTSHPELGTPYLKSSGAADIWQKSSGAAACRYLNQKVAPLPLLAYKTAAAAATLEKDLAKRTMAFKYGTQKWNFNFICKSYNSSF